MFPNFALKRLYIEKIPPNVSEMASKSIFREKLYFLQKFVERPNRQLFGACKDSFGN